MEIAMRNAIPPSLSVDGPRCWITSVTLSPLVSDVPKSPCRTSADVVEVLRRQRLVEPERRLSLRHQARGCRRAERRANRIARDEVDHEERRGEEQDERDREPRRAPKGVGRPLMAGPPGAFGARAKRERRVTSLRQPEARRQRALQADSELQVLAVTGGGRHLSGAMSAALNIARSASSQYLQPAAPTRLVARLTASL